MSQIYNGNKILLKHSAKTSAEAFRQACRRCLSQSMSRDHPRCNALTRDPSLAFWALTLRSGITKQSRASTFLVSSDQHREIHGLIQWVFNAWKSGMSPKDIARHFGLCQCSETGFVDEMCKG